MFSVPASSPTSLNDAGWWSTAVTGRHELDELIDLCHYTGQESRGRHASHSEERESFTLGWGDELGVLVVGNVDVADDVDVHPEYLEGRDGDR